MHFKLMKQFGKLFRLVKAQLSEYKNTGIAPHESTILLENKRLMFLSCLNMYF